jgi:hypothetical protein
LEAQREECEEQINNNSNDKAQIKEKRRELKEIEKKKRDAEKSAQKLIDFDNKILLVQDTPSPQFFSLLMSILSQDSIKDQQYVFTDKASNGKLLTNKNRIGGLPVIITTQVIDDTKTERFEEKLRRFIHISLNTSAEKIREANRLTSLKYGYLRTEYDKLVVSRTDIAQTKRIIKIVIAKLKKQKRYLAPEESGVKIPYALSVGESLPVQGWGSLANDRR